MTRLYFFSENNQQLGPFTLEELKTKRLKKSTLVWTDGMPDWATAYNVDEIKAILIPEPPPLPKKEMPKQSETILVKQPTQPTINLKYDPTYSKESGATVAGILLFFVPILVNQFTDIVKFDAIESYNQTLISISIAALIVRIVVIVLVVDIAKRQNRNSTNWGWLAFLLPSIALIVIGQLRKLRLKIEVDGNLSSKEQVSFLLEKANDFFDAKRNVECKEVLNKIIEIDKGNKEALKLRAIVYYRLNEFVESQNDFERLKASEQFLSIVNYYLGNLALKKPDINEAIKLWTIAREMGNKDAITQLDHYSSFRGKFVLTSNELTSKLNLDFGVNMDNTFAFGYGSKYLNGINQIDGIEKITLYEQEIGANELGIGVVFTKVFKSYRLGFGYTEIDDIIYDNVKKMICIKLFNNSEVVFDYDFNKNPNEVLRRICVFFQKETSKLSSAFSYLP